MQHVSVNYDALSTIGLTVWQPRAFRHPQNAADQTIIAPEILRIHARCVVLVFLPQLTATGLVDAEQKILYGMLSVLKLDSAQFMLVKVYGQEPDQKLISNHLRQWQPETVLQLSMQMPPIACAVQVVRTFSPQYLLHNAQHKSQAYKDLLNLRNILDHGTSQ